MIGKVGDTIVINAAIGSDNIISKRDIGCAIWHHPALTLFIVVLKLKVVAVIPLKQNIRCCLKSSACPGLETVNVCVIDIIPNSRIDTGRPKGNIVNVVTSDYMSLSEKQNPISVTAIGIDGQALLDSPNFIVFDNIITSGNGNSRTLNVVQLIIPDDVVMGYKSGVIRFVGVKFYPRT